MLWYVATSLHDIAFQACSFNHSDISPSLKSTICERSETVYPTRRRNPTSLLHRPCVERVDVCDGEPPRKLCQTFKVPRSLTADHPCPRRCSAAHDQPVGLTMRLLDVRLLRTRQSQPHRTCRSWFPVDESARRECLDHLVHHRPPDAEEPLEVRFGRRSSLNLRVVVGEREVLPLLRRERLRLADFTHERRRRAGTTRRRPA